VLPESCGYHAGTKALYVGNFGGAKLDAASGSRAIACGSPTSTRHGSRPEDQEGTQARAAGGLRERSDKLVKVEPADFLNTKNGPKVTEVFSGAGVNPNGVYPARDGRLYMVGFPAADKPKPIFALGVSGQIKPLSDPIGRLDGIYQLNDGSLLFTDWNTGSLSRWSQKGGVQKLADGFKGRADFCVVPGSGGAMTVVVPDLPQSQLRFIELSK